MHQGRLLGQFNFTLPGGITYNSADLVSDGKEEMTKVEEDIKNMSTSSWFVMIKR
jgi:hypothetical protein